MAIIKRTGNMSVVEAARKRIKNIFSNNVPIYLSFSGGKDSLALGHLIYSMIQRGEIDPSLLTVHFIDEEAIFPCVEQTVKEWRKKFLMVGAKFEWFCIEVRHFNCLNELEQNESFICWDRYKKDVWVRPMPKFAKKDHPLLKKRKDTYQDFLPRIESDGITLIGNRVYESLQRLQNASRMKKLGQKKQLFPIYDWRNSDVWLYLYEHNVKIPDVYLYLWQTGARLNDLRVSQFFSVDTAKTLVRMNEFYPDLMERVIKREPNAYLVSLYWDSEMFRRRSSKRKEIEKKKEREIDYKAELTKLLSNINKNFDTEAKRQVAKRYQRLFIKIHNIASEKHFKTMYEALMAGDPKLRTLRAIQTDVYADYREASRI